MIVHRKLATKTKEIECGELELVTVHTRDSHKSLLIQADKLDDDRYGYGFEIPLDELGDFVDRLQKMQARFDQDPEEFLQSLTSGGEG